MISNPENLCIYLIPAFKILIIGKLLLITEYVTIINTITGLLKIEHYNYQKSVKMKT